MEKGYLSELLKPFFRWWWAAVTGTATLIPLFFEVGDITIHKPVLSIMIFVFFTLTFLVLSVIHQSHKWYSEHSPILVVTEFSSALSDELKEVFRIESRSVLKPGQIVSILRKTERGTGCLAIVKVERTLGELLFQCAPIWMSPIHKADMANNTVKLSQLSATLELTESDVIMIGGGRQ